MSNVNVLDAAVAAVSRWVTDGRRIAEQLENERRAKRAVQWAAVRDVIETELGPVAAAALDYPHERHAREQVVPVTVALPHAAPIGVYVWWVGRGTRLAYRPSTWLPHVQCWANSPMAGTSEILGWERLIEAGALHVEVVWELAVAKAADEWARKRGTARSATVAESLQRLADTMSGDDQSGDYQRTLAAALVHMCRYGLPKGDE